MAHTKLPWRWDSDMVLAEHDGHTDHVADCAHRRDSDRFANAAFIVQAVNSHEALVSAVRMLLDRTANPITDHCLYTLDTARAAGQAALTAAKGTP